MRFKDKSVVVTGAAAGMGRQITLRFVEEGATVIAVDINNDALETLVKDVSCSEGKVIPFAGDISLQETNEKMIDLAVKECGRIDILVNNAGVGGTYEPVGELTNELWNKILRVNLDGPMYAIRKAVQVMRQQEGGGNIVSIASVAGLEYCRASVAYTVSKHGLVALCKHTAFMYMHEGIRCNVVCPGAIKTDMSDRHDNDSVFGKARVKCGMDPVVPFGTTNDIASAVLFLASDESGFISGETLVVDGGISSN